MARPTIGKAGLSCYFVLEDASDLYYTKDQLGSIIGVMDAKGHLHGSTEYTAYGAVRRASGAQADFGYAGMLYNAATGLYLTQYREYAPAAGRWLNRDPMGIAGGQNIYAYVGNSPLGRVDRQGDLWITAAIGAVTGGVAGCEAGGWQGAVAGGLVGGAVGFFAPQLSAEAGTLVGGGVAGMFASTGTTVALGAVAGGASTVLGNGIHNLTSQCKKNLPDGMGYGMALGGMAPLMSGEAFAAGSEAFAAGAGGTAIGEQAANAFSGATGVFTDVGEVFDPGATHGVHSPGSGSGCSCQN